MNTFKKYEFWFVVGSQFLYGPETLDQVAEHSQIMVDQINHSGRLPSSLVYKATVKTAGEITSLIKEANADDSCAGVVVWMHTFSPSKMWINGLALLQKPYLHLHTQFNRLIPNEGIDMDFMNLNQSAHGDREHGFIAARLKIKRKIVVGYWEDKNVQASIASWMRSAVGAMESKQLKLVRFGDNMREVAVTEGDKVEAQLRLGWQVNTFGVSELVQKIEAISEAEIDNRLKELSDEYTLNTDDSESVRYQVQVELALREFLESEGATAFSNTFEDLSGMKQLPGLATQQLMKMGYGYGGEGDWKVSAMVRVAKAMSEGLEGGTSFMEDYTYHLEEGNELVLGAHMLEVCPSLASQKPRIEVHPLGIGGKENPARLVFEGPQGPAILISLIDLGGRMRLIVHDVELVKPILAMPNLPVARIMWKPMPNLTVGAHAWILAGGSHHSVLSQAVTAEMMEDWAEIMGLEFVHITKDTKLDELKQQLLLSDLVWRMNDK